MATSGDIWLPLDPERPDSDMLYCQAWSDGDLNGFGLKALCSSSQIAMASALSALLAGSPVLYRPGYGVFKAKEGDYVMENFVGPAHGAGESDEACSALYDLICDTVTEIEEGDPKAALTGPLSSLSLSEKLEKGYGINARVLPPEEAWLSFRSFKHEAPLGEPQSSEQAANRLAQAVSDKQNVWVSNSYFWRERQFWGGCSVGEAVFVAPLIQLAAIKATLSAYCDVPAYLLEITRKDRDALLDLMASLDRVGAPLSGLFGGSLEAQLQSMYEAREMERSAGAPFPSQARKAL